MSNTFIKNSEDFKCENCGNRVIGNGYTNHCPKCLWSKHVDINPGDRKNKCGGMMKPVQLIGNIQKYTIIHRCEKCGMERKNKVAEDDDFEKIIRISKEEKRD